MWKANNAGGFPKGKWYGEGGLCLFYRIVLLVVFNPIIKLDLNVTYVAICSWFSIL